MSQATKMKCRYELTDSPADVFDNITKTFDNATEQVCHVVYRGFASAGLCIAQRSTLASGIKQRRVEERVPCRVVAKRVYGGARGGCELDILECARARKEEQEEKVRCASREAPNNPRPLDQDVVPSGASQLASQMSSSVKTYPSRSCSVA